MTGRHAQAPPPPPVVMSSSTLRATRPSTSAGASSAAAAAAAGAGPSHTLPVGIAPELPISRPRTAPAGSADPRPPPQRPVLDVVEALSSTQKGAKVLERMRDVFGTRRTELFRALSLYDTGRKHALTAQSFVAAIVSAGLRLSTTQSAELIHEICKLAGGNTGLVPPATDVWIDYNTFLDTLYE